MWSGIERTKLFNCAQLRAFLDYKFPPTQHNKISSANKDRITVGLCEIKLLLERQNPQAVYCSIRIPEQLLSAGFVIACTNFCDMKLKESAFLH